MHFAKQPRARINPPTLSGWFGNPECLRGLFNREPSKIAQFNELSLFRIHESKFHHRIVNREHLFVISVVGNFQIIHIQALEPSAVPFGVTTARPIDENTPHCFGSGGEKVSAILPLRLLVTAEP